MEVKESRWGSDIQDIKGVRCASTHLQAFTQGIYPCKSVKFKKGDSSLYLQTNSLSRFVWERSQGDEYYGNFVEDVCQLNPKDYSLKNFKKGLSKEQSKYRDLATLVWWKPFLDEDLEQNFQSGSGVNGDWIKQCVDVFIDVEKNSEDFKYGGYSDLVFYLNTLSEHFFRVYDFIQCLVEEKGLCEDVLFAIQPFYEKAQARLVAFTQSKKDRFFNDKFHVSKIKGLDLEEFKELCCQWDTCLLNICRKDDESVVFVDSFVHIDRLFNHMRSTITKMQKGLKKFRSRHELVWERVQEWGYKSGSLFGDFPELGSGGFGRVYKVTHCETGESYALKVFDYGVNPGEWQFHTEGEVLAGTRAEYHVPISRLVMVKGLIQGILMPFIPGKTLSKARLNKMSLTKIKRYFLHLARGVKELQDQKIVHHDLKPSNVMVDGRQDKALIIDFGLSRKVSKSRDSCECFYGSSLWSSPDVLARSRHGKGVDIWGLGLILYFLFKGRSPIHPTRVREFVKLPGAERTVKKWRDMKVMDLNDALKSIKDPQAVDLLKGLLKMRPKDRLSIEEVLKHPFLQA